MLNPAIWPGKAGSTRLVDIGHLGYPVARTVLVRMLRMPINPADLLAIDGRYAFPVHAEEPLGAEGVGRVEAIGSEVEDFSEGDLVLPLERGNWCRWRLVDQDQLIKLPSTLNIEQAAMLRINPATAWLLLDTLGLKRGDTLIQNAAGSSVASWVRTFALQRGITVVNIVRQATSELVDALMEGPELVAQVRGRGPAHGALDCVAGNASGRLAECLTEGGRLTVFGHLSGEPVRIASELLTGKGLTVSGFSLRPAENRLGRAGIRRLFGQLLAAGASWPTMTVRKIFPLRDAEQAIALARAPGAGRVQLEP